MASTQINGISNRAAAHRSIAGQKACAPLSVAGLIADAGIAAAITSARRGSRRRSRRDRRSGGSAGCGPKAVPGRPMVVRKRVTTEIPRNGDKVLVAHQFRDGRRHFRRTPASAARCSRQRPPAAGVPLKPTRSPANRFIVRSSRKRSTTSPRNDLVQSGLFLQHPGRRQRRRGRQVLRLGGKGDQVPRTRPTTFRLTSTTPAPT